MADYNEIINRTDFTKLDEALCTLQDLLDDTDIQIPWSTINAITPLLDFIEDLVHENAKLPSFK